MFNKNSLTHCPILRPSLDEFSDPITYLSSHDITKLGSEYGIVKIIPPENWKPTFSISDQFKFHTRLQKISDLGLTTRSRQFFIDNINRFLKMRRKRQLQLYFNPKSDPSKQIYYYDIFIQIENLGGITTMTANKWKQLNHHFKLSINTQDLEHEFNTNVRSYAMYLQQNNSNFEFPESDSEDEFDNCLICGKHDNPGLTLLCDNCDNPYHTYCLPNPLSSIPSSNWYCDKCLIGTGEYGFEEEVDVKYSLSQFYDMCLKFESEFIKKYNDNKPLTTDDIELKFWKFVDIQKSDLQVKYGADIHNLKPGEISGFPMSNTPGIKLDNPNTQYYMNHPFNLTKLPFANGSLLNYINSPISGMTIPWIYIGSLLSTFCWHVEDHYTLSANYCHFGATKKWYGIPSSQADKFERLMKDSAPDLFKRQPDLLHQLVTLLSPMTLIENGIKVVYADQNPNEFIITYPRVYHAGFNCGFNFNEAVNFTMNNWLEFGEKSINDYKLIGKENVFNHYKLLENILKSFNKQRGKINDNEIALVKTSLKSFETEFKKQNDLLFDLDKSKFNVEYRPSKVRKGKKLSKMNPYDHEEDLYDEDEEDDEPLCDICKTHLGYQYCIINNKDHKFSYSKQSGLTSMVESNPSQLLTPHPSPNEGNNKPQSIGNDVAESIAKSESSQRLGFMIDNVKREESKDINDTNDDADDEKEEDEYDEKSRLCMMAQFDKLINEAKRKAKQEDDDDVEREGNVKRRSKRLQEHPVDVNKGYTTLHPRTIASTQGSRHNKPESHVQPSSRMMMGKMTMVQKISSMKRLNVKDSIDLCLQCCNTTFNNSNDSKKNGATIPHGSILLYETYPSQLKELIKETKRNLEEVSYHHK